MSPKATPQICFRKIAVVEDDPNVLVAMKNLLNALGVLAEGFESTRQFLDHGQLDRFDCLVLNINLWAMPTLELKCWLNVFESALPIVLTSVFADERDRRTALQSSGVALLRKPFTADQLSAAITNACEFHSLSSAM
jgi:FixJ family two-component response regulator